MRLSKQILAWTAMFSMAACASPKVHDEVHHMDHRLSCSQMEHEIREMEKHRASVEESKGFTFRNVLTTVAFFPITMATYSNVNEAQDASSNRQQHLMSLYAMKGCNAEGYVSRQVIRPVAHTYSQEVETISTQGGEAFETVNFNRYSPEHIHSAAYLFEN